MITRRSAAQAALAFAVLGRVGSGADESRKALETGLKRQKDTYEASKQRIKLGVLGEFDRLIRNVDGLRTLNEGAKGDRKSQLGEDKVAFERYGTFPATDEFDLLTLRFASDMNSSFDRCQQAVGQIGRSATKKHWADLTDAARKLREELAQDIATFGKFSSDSVFHGPMTQSGGRTIPYRVFFNKVGDGGSFKGLVHDNWGVQGNWNYEMEGQTNGLAYVFELSRSLRGSLTGVRATGFVCGARLFGKVVQRVGSGQPVQEQYVLRRV